MHLLPNVLKLSLEYSLAEYYYSVAERRYHRLSKNATLHGLLLGTGFIDAYQDSVLKRS